MTTAEIDQRLSRIEDAQAEHAAGLRGIAERLDRIIEILTPLDSAGPTLDEILAQLVAVISDQTLLLRRLDGRTAAIGARVGMAEEEAGAPPGEADGRSGRGRPGKGSTHPPHDNGMRFVE